MTEDRRKASGAFGGDSRPNVVIPYDRFLEGQERRRRMAADSIPFDQPPAAEADLAPVEEQAPGTFGMIP
jgi:hypothetical protein